MRVKSSTLWLKRRCSSDGLLVLLGDMVIVNNLCTVNVNVSITLNVSRKRKM